MRERGGQRSGSRPSAGAARRRAAAPTGPSPWVGQMYGVYALLAAAGLVVFVFGSGMVQSRKVYDDQVPGIDLAILGAVLINGAGALLLMAGRRAVVARRLRLFGALPPAGRAAEPVHVSARADQLVGGEGLRHFHRADCALAAGRSWPTLDRVEQERAGRIPCGVCKP